VEELFDIVQEAGARHCLVWSHEPSGLRALVVIDDVTLGPAAGGIRTVPYPSVVDALRDAASLARAMTLKCAIGGLDAGGGKIVVMEHADLNREAAFEELGRRLNDLGGRFRAGSDLGTRTSDLEAAARATPFVHANIQHTAAGVARGVLRGIEACAELRERRLEGLEVAIQGCGVVGAAVAETLAAAGARLYVADVRDEKARAVADRTGATVAAAEEILTLPVDVVSPCAVGGLLTRRRAADIKAWAVCGGANNILSSPDVAEVFLERGIYYVPEIIASAGGVIEGVGEDVMNLKDTTGLIDALGPIAREVLRESRVRNLSSVRVAEERARARIAARRS